MNPLGLPLAKEQLHSHHPVSVEIQSGSTTTDDGYNEVDTPGFGAPISGRLIHVKEEERLQDSRIAESEAFWLILPDSASLDRSDRVRIGSKIYSVLEVRGDERTPPVEIRALIARSGGEG